MSGPRRVRQVESAGASRSVTAHDAAIGRQIKRRRAVLAITQWQLADQLGVSFQQLHKYETGVNRVPAMRLLDIAKALATPIEWFFEGSGQPPEGHPLGETLLETQSRELVSLLANLTSPQSRERFLKLARFYVAELDKDVSDN